MSQSGPPDGPDLDRLSDQLPDVGGILQFGLVLGILAVIAGIVGLLFFAATVDEGERGVLKAQSAVTGEVLDPGWHYPLVPFYNSVEYIEVRPQTYTMSGDIHEGETEVEDAVVFRSADQQEVGVDVTVRYRVEPDQVDQFHVEWNTIPQFEQRLLRPVIVDTVAREASAFEAVEANSDEGRALMAEVVTAELREEAPEYVEIESVQIRDMHFDEEFRRALEQQEIASAEADARRERAEGEADAARINAEGDADAERIRAEGQAEALRTIRSEIDGEILAYEQIQAYDDGTVFVVDGETNSLIQVSPEDIESGDGDGDGGLDIDEEVTPDEDEDG